VPVVALAPALSLALMASHALMTVEHTVAVVFDPPAGGAGGNALSPSSTVTFDSGTPRLSAACCPITV